MDSPLLEQHPCPSCQGLIDGADLHRCCVECLGSDHAVVEMEEHDDGVPFVFAMPADRAAPVVGGRDDDDDTTLSDASGGLQEGPHHRSARQDFSAVMAMAAEHMRRLQRWFSSLRLDPKRHKQRPVTIPPSVEGNLRFWGSPDHLRRGLHWDG